MILTICSMFYQLLFIHLYRPFLKYTKSTSPLPQHVSPRKLCTQAASTISKLLRIYKRNYGFRQICNIVVYIAHTACTIHLLNLPERNAQRDIIHGLRNLEEMAESWLCARRTLRILDISANKWQVALPREALSIFERTHTKWGSWGSWDQATSPSTSDESPSMVTAQPSAPTPSAFSPPERHISLAQHSSTSTPGPVQVTGPMGNQFQPGSSAAASLQAMREAHRSFSAQMQRADVPLPEPTYLRPVYQPVPTVPLSQHDTWFSGTRNQIRPLNAGQETPSTTTTTTATSPMHNFDTPENLVEESQHWWSRGPNAMNLGIENWPDGWSAGVSSTAAPSLRYEGQIPSSGVGQAPVTDAGSRPSQSLTFPIAVPTPSISESGTDPNTSGYSNVMFPGNFQQ